MRAFLCVCSYVLDCLHICLSVLTLLTALSSGASQISPWLPQVFPRRGFPAGSSDLQGEVRGRQIPVSQRSQDAEGADPSGPD